MSAKRARSEECKRERAHRYNRLEAAHWAVLRQLSQVLRQRVRGLCRVGASGAVTDEHRDQSSSTHQRNKAAWQRHAGSQRRGAQGGGRCVCQQRLCSLLAVCCATAPRARCTPNIGAGAAGAYARRQVRAAKSCARHSLHSDWRRWQLRVSKSVGEAEGRQVGRCDGTFGSTVRSWMHAACSSKT